MYKQRTLLAAIAITAAAADEVVALDATLYGLKQLAIEANFTYGSGGTDLKVWIQTSLDGGEEWIDIVCFRFLTTSKRVVANVNSQTPITTVYTPTDGSLANDSVKDGILGDRLRIKKTSTGTYAGGTTLAVNIVPKG